MAAQKGRLISEDRVAGSSWLSELRQSFVKIRTEGQNLVELSDLENIQNVFLDAAQSQFALGGRHLFVHRDQLAQRCT